MRSQEATLGLTRRSFIARAAGATAAGLVGCSADRDLEGEADDGWERGSLRHLLPAVSHRSIILKASFAAPLAEAPLLRVGEREAPGVRGDSQGRFFSFRITGLEPATTHVLRLRSARGDALCDPWLLRTFPAPDAKPDRLRILTFTCAGGISTPILPPALFDPFRPPAYRRRLFDLALAMEPDCAIANGDHVYYDLAQMGRVQANPLHALAGGFIEATTHRFDPALPVFGGPNEQALIGVGDDQIAQIYGVRFRSTPVFFVTDDHDYFENDDATPERVTFPPDAFHRALRDTLQRLYFPEFPAEAPLPDGVPGVGIEHGVRASRQFGELRYGDLASGLLYDCGGHLSLGPEAGLVPPAVERWLVGATRREDTIHQVHVPSHPMGWTAGKWREWYPDHLEHTRSLVAGVERGADGHKYLWQHGWWQQHQRLLAALAGQRRRAALSVSGDLHALGALRMKRSGELDLAENPVHTVLAGPVGTGAVGWPSRARGVAPRVPEALEAEPVLDLEERNGFTTLDFDREAVRVVTWGCPEGYVAPASLGVEPALELDIRRRG